MTFLKRLRLASGVLGVAALGAAITGAVLGDAKSPTALPAVAPAAPKAVALIDELARTRFSDRPALAYRTAAGETLFAWQVKPKIDAPAQARPRDVLVMIDTSASQAGDALSQAVRVAATLARDLDPADRIDLWTVNLNHKDLTRSVTGKFLPARGEEIKEAVARFSEREYGAGAVDLKAGLEEALKAFDQKAGRQQVILYLGDGESAAGLPITEPVRAEIGNRLADKDVQFFAVPLGSTLCPENLHGLTTLTGGAVVRAQEGLKLAADREQFFKRLVAALDVPVLRADKVTFGPADAEVFPNRLPPLRADRATLVMGRLPAPAANLTLRVEGTVGDRREVVELAERLPAAQAENYFLSPMLAQWRDVAAKDTPALLPADRTLAMASEQFRMYRDEFVELGMQAIKADRFDHAEQLFKASVKIDPAHGDATEGLKLVAGLRTGSLTKEKLQQKVKAAREAGAGLANVSTQEPPPAPGATPPPAAAPAGPAPSELDRRIAARAVAEQEQRAVVQELLKRARQLRATDPDAAYDDLKRQRDAILLNGDLSDNVRRALGADLEAQMRDIQTQGGEIKRRLAAERERISAARYRLTENDRLQSAEDLTKARIDRFRDLMAQAKFDVAYQEAQALADERTNRGLNIPPEVAATYRIGQQATQMREYRETRRVRDNNYLLTMAQVEKSFIPYPDEPPMHLPPATVWNELRTRRQRTVNNLAFGGAGPTQTLVRLRSIVEDVDLNGNANQDPQPTSRGGRRVDLPLPLKDQKVTDVLEKLERDYDAASRAGGIKLRFVVRYDLLNAVEAGAPFAEKKFKSDVNLSGLTLGAFLDNALLDVGASYFVRPEYIEITTKQMRIEEKVTRAFEVADLIFELPNAVNNQTLQQNLAVFGSQIQNAALLAGAQNYLGGGAFGNGGGGQFQGAGGPAGMMGQFAQNVNQLGVNANLGVGGGFTGATGGQIGQFGNLGGQFGIQGNKQPNILIALLTQVVAKGEWETNTTAGVVQQPTANPETPLLAPNLLNSIGFHPPTNTLVIRATSRYHSATSFKVNLGADAGAAAGANANPNILANAGGNAGAGAQANAGPALRNPVADARAIVAKAGKDPKKVWNEAFDWAVTDPNLIVSATEVLFALNEHAHAAEALKAALRHGHANAEWTHEALAIALQASQAGPIEIERAAMSAIDLAPRDPKAYLRAAKAESELGRHAAAVGLCQQAAAMEPNLPTAYANALAYLERSGDAATDTVAWASSNLLKRDWANDGTDYAASARDRVARIAGRIAATRPADAALLTKSLDTTTTRDLVVELRWQGPADLDLTVAEPSGSTCGPLARRTTAGGVLRTDFLGQKDEARTATYTAAEAFPGRYAVTVKSALGRAVGNKATLKVTRRAGTPDEMFELFDIDLSSGKPTEFVLADGGRKDLAELPPEEISYERMATTAAPKTLAASGFTGGSGRADAASVWAANNPMSTANTASMVNQSTEGRLPGMTPALPSMRVTATSTAGNGAVEVKATPVFAGAAADIPLPKMRLLPGATGR